MKEASFNLKTDGRLAQAIKKQLEEESGKKITIECLSFSARYQELNVHYEMWE